MRNKLRILALAVLVCLALTGCGGRESSGDYAGADGEKYVYFTWEEGIDLDWENITIRLVSADEEGVSHDAVYIPDQSMYALLLEQTGDFYVYAVNGEEEVLCQFVSIDSKHSVYHIVLRINPDPATES